MTNDTSGSCSADDAPLVVGYTFSALESFTDRYGIRRYRNVNFIAGRELVEENFIEAGTPAQSRVMTRVWNKKLHRYDNHPRLVVNGSITPTQNFALHQTMV